jgi:hypothetical protein
MQKSGIAMSEDKRPEEETEEVQATDLSSLEGLSFGPSWAKAPPSNPYVGREDWGEDAGGRRDGRDGRRGGGFGGGRERRRDGGRGEREGRREFRGGDGARREGGRREFRGGGRGEGERRPAGERGGAAGAGSPEGRREGAPRGPRREGERGERRGPRERVERMKVNVSFLPDRERLMLVVRDIQATRRAFPLMEIASKFVARDDSYLLKLELPQPKEGEERKVFWQCRECKRVFCHKANAEAHVENAHLDLFFAQEEQVGEAPAGAFNCVARCGLSGELLGPPNFHGYNERIQEIWSTRFAHVPKAEYLSKIEILHDEALLEEWKEQARHQIVYRLRLPEEKPAEAKPAAEEKAAESAESVSEKPEVPESPEIPAEASVEAAAEATETAGEPPAPPAEAPAAPADPPAPRLGEPMDRKSAQAWIRENKTQRMLRESGRCMVPGLQSHKWDDISLRSAVDSARYREKQFPFSLSLALRPAFRHMRLSLFKINARETYVGAVAPKAFDEATAAAQDKEIVAFLREHPEATRQAVLDGLRPGAGAESPEGADILLHLDGLVTQGVVLVLNNGVLWLPKVAAAQTAGEAAPEAAAEQSEAQEQPENSEQSSISEDSKDSEGSEGSEQPEEPVAGEEPVEELARQDAAPPSEAPAEPVAEAAGEPPAAPAGAEEAAPVAEEAPVEPAADETTTPQTEEPAAEAETTTPQAEGGEAEAAAAP